MEEQNVYRQLAEAIGTGDSRYIPKIFETLADEKEARLLLAAAPPATAEEIAEKSGLTEDEVAARIEPLFAKGLLFKSKKPDATRYYRVRHLLQFHDATAVMNDPPDGMLDLWKTFMAEEYPAYSRMVEQVLPAAYARVIPINETVQPEGQILAPDDIRQVVQNARNLAVTPCSCRVIDGACGKPVEVCVQLDKAADYAIERGTGRKLEKDEALTLMEKCAQEGLVHVSDNKRSPGHVICNCCSDCCMNWPSIRSGAGKLVAPSRFTAQVDDQLCSACETCTDTCFFDAIAMTGEDDTAAVTAEKCMGCGLCVAACPEGAIFLKETRPEDFIPA